MKNLKFALIIVLAFVFNSCSSDSDDDIVNDPGNTEITYTNTIRGIMSGNCTSCHGTTPSNNAPMSLTTLEDVKNAIQTRNLIGRIENGTMPPSGSLSSTQIQQIKTWQSNGFPQ